MGDFSTTGIVNVGDALASLALVRALIVQLARNKVIDGDDVFAIHSAALNHLPHGNSAGENEARRLLNQLL